MSLACGVEVRFLGRYWMLVAGQSEVSPTGGGLAVEGLMPSVEI